MLEPDGFDFKFDFHNHINYGITVNTLDADTVSVSKYGFVDNLGTCVVGLTKLDAFSAVISINYYVSTNRLCC